MPGGIPLVPCNTPSPRRPVLSSARLVIFYAARNARDPSNRPPGTVRSTGLVYLCYPSVSVFSLPFSGFPTPSHNARGLTPSRAGKRIVCAVDLKKFQEDVY